MLENKLIGTISIGAPVRQGEKGEIGPQGPRGEKGEIGPQGPRGEKGEKGATGEKGETGAEGKQGPKGDRGEQGERGPKGETGLIGPTGHIGPQGERGIQGPRGEQGPQGKQGERGPQGIQGVKGEIGPVGPKGEQGEKGEIGEAAIINEKISDVNTWSSKRILDSILEDSTWEEIKGTTIEDSKNGYIKGLEIEGHTIKNDEGVQGVGLKTEKGYKIGVNVHGKNLVYKEFENAYIETSSREIRKVKGCYCFVAKVEPNKTYVISSVGGNRRTLGTTTKEPSIGSKLLRVQTGTTISTEENENYLIWYANNESVPKAKKVQIEEGSHATSYQPYKESTSEIILQEQLQGIGDIKDRLYYNEGYKVDKKIGKVTLNGSEGWKYWTKEDTHTGAYIPSGFIDVGENKQCEADKVQATLKYAPKTDSVYIGGNNGIYLLLNNSKLETNDVAGIKKYLQSNNINLWYIKATSTTTDTQIKTELLPQTYKNKTYISVDSGVSGELKGQYPKDTTKEEIKQILQELGVIKSLPTTLEEMEADEPTTLEELTDEPTTLEE